MTHKELLGKGWVPVNDWMLGGIAKLIFEGRDYKIEDHKLYLKHEWIEDRWYYVAKKD